MVVHRRWRICGLHKFQSRSGSVFQSISESWRTLSESILQSHISWSHCLRRWIIALMDKNVRVLGCPTWFFSLVFECFAKRVGPRRRKSNPATTWIWCYLPFYPTLLPTSFIAHTLADDAPEDVVVDIFTLINSHLSDYCGQLVLFVLPPRPYISF